MKRKSVKRGGKPPVSRPAVIDDPFAVRMTREQAVQIAVREGLDGTQMVNNGKSSAERIVDTLFALGVLWRSTDGSRVPSPSQAPPPPAAPPARVEPPTEYREKLWHWIKQGQSRFVAFWNCTDPQKPFWLMAGQGVLVSPEQAAGSQWVYDGPVQ